MFDIFFKRIFHSAVSNRNFHVQRRLTALRFYAIDSLQRTIFKHFHVLRPILKKIAVDISKINTASQPSEWRHMATNLPVN